MTGDDGNWAFKSHLLNAASILRACHELGLFKVEAYGARLDNWLDADGHLEPHAPAEPVTTSPVGERSEAKTMSFSETYSDAELFRMVRLGAALSLPQDISGRSLVQTGRCALDELERRFAAQPPHYTRKQHAPQIPVCNLGTGHEGHCPSGMAPNTTCPDWGTR